jgi:hypothetical protein
VSLLVAKKAPAGSHLIRLIPLESPPSTPIQETYGIVMKEYELYKRIVN